MLKKENILMSTLIMSSAFLSSISSMHHKSIRVYNGPGTEIVDQVVIPSFSDSLKRIGIFNSVVEPINATEIEASDWLDSTDIFVLPGGRDLPYVRDLKEQALENLRKFVHNGGSFIGLCAGAYFSSSYVIFEKGTPLQVEGPRDLKFFLGTTQGSVYPGFNYNSTKGAVVAPLSTTDSFPQVSTNMSSAYFNGGCHFIPNDDFTNFETLALYSDFPGKIAIVSMKYGKGGIILSGVHPEIDVKYLSRATYTEKQWNDMQHHVDIQRALLDAFLKKLLNL